MPGITHGHLLTHLSHRCLAPRPPTGSGTASLPPRSVTLRAFGTRGVLQSDLINTSLQRCVSAREKRLQPLERFINSPPSTHRGPVVRQDKNLAPRRQDRWE